MLKKATPIFLLSALVLGGCTTNEAVPDNNETPMEDVQDREKNWTPNVDNNEEGGMDLDGVEDENRDMEGKGTINNGTNTSPDETIIEEGDKNRDKMNKDDMNKNEMDR